MVEEPPKRGDRRWLEPSALQILEKWKARLGIGWEASDSDVLRHLDAVVETHERAERAREPDDRRPRRLGVGPR